MNPFRCGARATIRRLCTLALVAGVLPAQDDGAVTLHAAWLREVLDLDVAAAADGYRRVAGAEPRGEGWIAAARLWELRRLGATVVAPPPVTTAPEALRSTFAAVQVAESLDPVLAELAGDPAAIVEALGNGTPELPPLRIAVPAAQTWLGSQIGPSLRDRWRQRVGAVGAAERGFRRGAGESLYATDVLRAELQGRRSHANALRSLWFAGWRAPAADAEPGPLLARARRNLAALLAEQPPNAPATPLLRELEAVLAGHAEQEPTAGLELLRRLPFYAERLLVEPARPATGR